MSETHASGAHGRAGSGVAAAPGAVGWLGLAAAPTFGLMGLWTAVSGGGQDALCASLPTASPIDGMALMYALMSVFHATPWLKLIHRR